MLEQYAKQIYKLKDDILFSEMGESADGEGKAQFHFLAALGALEQARASMMLAYLEDKDNG